MHKHKPGMMKQTENKLPAPLQPSAAATCVLFFSFLFLCLPLQIKERRKWLRWPMRVLVTAPRHFNAAATCRQIARASQDLGSLDFSLPGDKWLPVTVVIMRVRETSSESLSKAGDASRSRTVRTWSTGVGRGHKTMDVLHKLDTGLTSSVEATGSTHKKSGKIVELQSICSFFSGSVLRLCFSASKSQWEQ